MQISRHEIIAFRLACGPGLVGAPCACINYSNLHCIPFLDVKSMRCIHLYAARSEYEDSISLNGEVSPSASPIKVGQYVAK